MCTGIYAGNPLAGFLIILRARAAKNTTSTPIIQALQDSAVSRVKPNTQGEMKTHIPSTILMTSGTGDEGIASPHNATITITTPRIQAFHELVP